MKGARQSAFVVGLAENGYGIVRSLAHERIPIVGCYTGPRAFGRFSKHCVAYYLHPSTRDEEQICQRLIEWSGRCGAKPVLFPTSDYYVQLLVNHSGMISEHGLYHWVSPEDLSRIVDKAQMTEACQKAGVLVPRTHITRREEDIAESIRNFPFPCLVKPRRSFGTPFPVAMKNFVAQSPRHLLDFYKRHPNLEGTTVWQEIIEGGDEDIFQCTALVRNSGKVGAYFCTRKIRQYVPGFGIMCFGRSENNDAVVAEALKLLGFLHYHGVASIEFKYQQRDGRYYFIEMNPRFPWYSSLFVDAGVNLPYLAYLDLTREIDCRRLGGEQTDGVYWVGFREDLGWLFQTRKERPVSILRWLRSVAGARSHAWWNWRDPKPFLRAALHLLGIGVRTFARLAKQVEHAAK